jgi:hypothetical protein
MSGIKGQSSELDSSTKKNHKKKHKKNKRTQESTPTLTKEVHSSAIAAPSTNACGASNTSVAHAETTAESVTAGARFRDVNIVVHENVTIDKVQFDNLLRENGELRLRVDQLNGNADLLRETVRVNDITIAELRAENDMLKKRIAEMSSDITALREKADKQSTFLNILKLQISIQDLNKSDDLANLIDVNLRSSLSDMKSARIGECHYLVDQDRPELLIYKKYILHEKLRSLSANVATKFGSLFAPGLLLEIKNYLQTTLPAAGADSSISPIEKYNVEMWWAV